MTQEEKAKRYDEALKVLHKYDGAHIMFTQDLKEEMFPELKKSEDERIRKGILHLIDCASQILSEIEWCKANVSIGEIQTWLKKQGEQKPKTEYIYLKFREGDTIQKITGDKDIVTIAEVDTEAEEYRLTNSGFIPFKYEHLWYIVEQKPMPIFRIGETIIAKGGTNIIKEPFHIDKIEDDYYWDGENTILVCNQDEFELAEQKPVWSEEDKYKISRLTSYLKRLGNDVYVEWLESLKERYIWKPSDEQMIALSDINITGVISYVGQGQELINLYNELKKLKG